MLGPDRLGRQDGTKRAPALAASNSRMPQGVGHLQRLLQQRPPASIAVHRMAGMCLLFSASLHSLLALAV